MATAIKTPTFLSRSHLAKWLRESRDGQAALEAARPYSFDSLQALERWLQSTAEGNDVLSRFEGTRRKVLVVLYSDGWVEAYSTKDVDVRCVVKPYASTPEGGAIADRYLEATLPGQYAELYAPGNRRNADKCRKVTAAQLLAARCDLELLKTLDAVTT